jgi:hypothetical protein
MTRTYRVIQDREFYIVVDSDGWFQATRYTREEAEAWIAATTGAR